MNLKILGIIRMENLEVEYGEITMKGVCRIDFINALEITLAFVNDFCYVVNGRSAPLFS